MWGENIIRITGFSSWNLSKWTVSGSRAVTVCRQTSQLGGCDKSNRAGEGKEET